MMNSIIEYAMYSDITGTCVMCETETACCLVEGSPMCAECAGDYIQQAFDSLLNCEKEELLGPIEDGTDLDIEFEIRSLEEKAELLGISFEYIA